MTPFSAQVEIAAEIIARIKEALGDDPDAPTIIETETDDVLSKLRWMARQIVIADEEADGVAYIRKERDKELRARQERWEQQSQRLRGTLTWAIERLGLEGGRLKAPDFTAFVTTPKHGPVEVPDPTAVPDEFSHIVKTPDKARIKQLLEGGMCPNWASYGPARPRLTIRRV
jgi:hypothetical protein